MSHFHVVVEHSDLYVPSVIVKDEGTAMTEWDNMTVFVQSKTGSEVKTSGRNQVIFYNGIIVRYYKCQNSNCSVAR